MQKFSRDLSIGDNLQRLRKLCNLSQYDMIAKLQLLGQDMSRANYTHIEQGIRSIYVSALLLFKKLLNGDYAEFLKASKSSSSCLFVGGLL